MLMHINIRSSIDQGEVAAHQVETVVESALARMLDGIFGRRDTQRGTSPGE